MCGIAGHWHPGGAADPDLALRLLQGLRHRGPDGGGLWAGSHCVLAHARLALHDLGPAGVQPMADPRGRVVAAVNGTFHDAPEQRRALTAWSFRSRSDSELVLPLYLQHKEQLVHHLRGPFALALHEPAEGRLLLARDRLGQKPLFYARQDGGLAFASEQGALVRTLSGLHYDPLAAASLLQAGYVPGEATLVREIRALPPGHLLVADASGVRITRWWHPPSAAGPALKPREAAELLQARLAEAVRLRLRTERDLGLLLSGGLDSAALLLLMTRARDAPARTFTLGFQEPRWDERPAAAGTAAHLGARHHAWPFDRDPGPWLQGLVARTGEPLADSSWLAAARLMELASQHATVLLSGEGGDELLGGYRRHRLAGLREPIPGPLRRSLALLGRGLPPGQPSRALAVLGAGDLPAAAADAAGLLPWARLRPFLRPETFPAGGPLAAHLRELLPDGARGREGAARLDLLAYLPGDLLPKADRAAMASGVEVWCPFLDPPLVEAMLSCRAAAAGLRGKGALRSMLAGRVPPELLRRPKRGFGVPLAAWLQEGSYGRFAEELLGDTPGPFTEVLREGSALGLLRRFRAGGRAPAPLVHACVVLALWWTEVLGRR